MSWSTHKLEYGMFAAGAAGLIVGALAALHI